MSARRLRALLAGVLLALALSLSGHPFCPEASARPGGGQSFGGSKSSSGSGSGSRSTSGGGSSRSSGYSGGGSRSSSGSGSKNDSSSSWSSRPDYSAPWTKKDSPSPSKGSRKSGPILDEAPSGPLLAFFFWIIAAIFVVVVIVMIASTMRSTLEKPWDSGITSSSSPPPRREKRRKKQSFKTIPEAIASLSGEDADFSQIIFEDFAYALFTEVHVARGADRVRLLEPYLEPGVMSQLGSDQVDGVRDVIVGAMTIENIWTSAETRRVFVRIAFTANLTEERAGKTQSYYLEEKWTLGRSADARSRAPEKATVIGCPNCGASLDKLVGEKCRYCNEVIEAGTYDWCVGEIETASREERGPLLTGETAEEGTDFATVVDPDAEAQLTALMRTDPSFKYRSLVARVEHIFSVFHEAWSGQDLAAVRPYLSDRLFDTQRYWIEAYRAQGLRNVTSDRAVATVHLAAVRSDKFYDSITVRVFASCVDQTFDDSGKRVGGSSSVRFYSEYWTFIRSALARGEPRTDPGCPNCGAPIGSIDVAGKCRSCNAKVTRGDFDWILSRIEQDEVYQG